MAETRSPDNCPFYPACYIAGDCGPDDWKISSCGLPKAEQQQLSTEWRQRLGLGIGRASLSRRLQTMVGSGALDHLLGATDDDLRGRLIEQEPKR
ncbi:MAG: hypothetical protein AB7O91_03975 [Sphingomonas sp.]